MTQQEAYMVLKEKIDAINAAINEMIKFAREHQLAVGQPRYDPMAFECVNPATGVPDDFQDENFDQYEWWIGSEVCY